MGDGVGDVSGAGLALERIIAAPSVILRRASPRLVAPHTKGTLKAHLPM
ncbi:MAG: hypothetical protein R2709_04180 [Marmoricola sp.]